jgi:protein ImuA
MAVETPQRNLLLARLRDEIRRLERRPDRRSGSLPCALAGVEEALPAGGFPRGALSELRGGPASGKTAVALSLVAALPQDELAAYVDGAGELYPPAATALGVDLGRLLLVRSTGDAQAPGERSGDAQARAEVGRGLPPRRVKGGEAAACDRRERSAEGAAASARDRSRPCVDLLWAAESLLASGAFSVVIIDVPLPAGMRGADGILRRLQAAAEKGGTVGIWLSAPGAAARAPAGVRLDLSRRDGRILAERGGRTGFAGAERSGHAA